MRHALWLVRLRLVAFVAGGMLAIATVAAAVIMFFTVLDGYGFVLHSGTRLNPKAARVDTLILWQPLAVPRAAADSNFTDSLFKEQRK